MVQTRRGSQQVVENEELKVPETEEPLEETVEDVEVMIEQEDELVRAILDAGLSTDHVVLLRNKLGVKSVEDLDLVNKEMLTQIGILPIPALRAEQSFKKEVKTTETKRGVKLPSAFYENKYKNPKSQAALPWLEGIERMLSFHELPKNKWPQALAQVIDVDTKKELARTIEKLDSWETARQIFLKEAPSVSAQAEASDRLTRFIFDGKNIESMAQEYLDTYYLAGKDYLGLAPEVKAQLQQRDAEALLLRMRGSLLQQLSWLVHGKERPQTVEEVIGYFRDFRDPFDQKKRQRGKEAEPDNKNKPGPPGQKKGRYIKPSGRETDPAEVTCFGCRKKGHFKKDCPQNQGGTQNE